MKDFLINCKLESVRKKLYLLYLFNVTDIIFTYLLLNTGLFEEGNMLLKPIIDNPFITIILKVILIFILIFIIAKRLSRASKKQLKISNRLIIVILVVYLIINLSHVYWLFRVISL